MLGRQVSFCARVKQSPWHSGANMRRRSKRKGVVVPPMGAPRSATPGNPEPARSADQDAARGGDRKATTAGQSDTLDPMQAPATGRPAPDPRSTNEKPKPVMPPGEQPTMAPPMPPRDAPTDARRTTPWLKIILIAACLAVATAGWWWFYGDNAASHVETTIPPAARPGEDPAGLKQAAKLAELGPALQQAEWLAATYQELLAKERRRSKELEQELATRQNDHQLLAQERERSKGLEQQLAARQNDQESLAQERERSKGLEQQLAARQIDQQLLAQERDRIKELEQQLAASRQLPPVQPMQPMTDPDPRNATPTYRPPEGMIKPQPTVRRTGPRPLPKVTLPMPRFSLQASDLTYNPARYWQVTVTLTSNTSRTLDAQVHCSFLSAERSVGEASFGPTAVAPGEQISTDLIGPPMAVYVDSTTCRLVGQ
jgi:hypothetical protein